MAKLDIKGIFFDFDDTLQSRKGAYRLYCESFLDKYFPDIDDEERFRKLDEMEEYEGHSWQDEAHIRLENCIKTFLRDMFPNYDYVVVDVMW